jgi:hypothetical protein
MVSTKTESMGEPPFLSESEAGLVVGVGDSDPEASSSMDSVNQFGTSTDTLAARVSLSGCVVTVGAGLRLGVGLGGAAGPAGGSQAAWPGPGQVQATRDAATCLDPCPGRDC